MLIIFTQIIYALLDNICYKKIDKALEIGDTVATNTDILFGCIVSYYLVIIIMFTTPISIFYTVFLNNTFWIDLVGRLISEKFNRTK